MATSYSEFTTMRYQGKDYLIVYVDPQNLYYSSSASPQIDAYGNILSGQMKSDYTLPDGDNVGTNGEDKRDQNLLRDGTTPEKALVALPDDLRCPILPRTRAYSKQYLNNFAASSDANGIPQSAYFDANKYGVCYLIKRSEIYDNEAGYTNIQRKESVAASYDVPLYPHNATYDRKEDKNEPYSLRNIMFLGCPKETDDLYYLLPEILKDKSNTKLWNKWVGSSCEYANIYVDITPNGYPNIIEDSNSNSTTIKISDDGFNEFQIFKTTDKLFQSLVINRCYFYRKSKTYDFGTFGAVPIFDIRNASDNTKTSIVIENSKFGFCELTSTTTEATTTWNDHHWSLEQENWNTAETDNKRCRRFIMVDAAQYLKFNNNIINYISCDYNGFDNGSNEEHVKYHTDYGATRMGYINGDRIFSTNNSSNNRTGWRCHAAMNDYRGDFACYFGDYILDAQVINNKINTLTSLSRTNINANNDIGDDERFIRRTPALVIKANGKNDPDNRLNWRSRTSLDLYNISNKYIFNKCNASYKNIIPEMLYVDGFHRTIIKNVSCEFQNDTKTGKIQDAGALSPKSLVKERNAVVDIRIGDQYDISNINLKLQRCWNFDSKNDIRYEYSADIRNEYINDYHGGRLLKIDRAYKLDGRGNPGKIERLSNITLYAANGDHSQATINEGYGDKNNVGFNNDSRKSGELAYIDMKRYNKIIINPITIQNYWGNALYLCGGQIPDNTCRIYGGALFDCVVGTVEFVNSSRPGDVISVNSGTTLRIKKLIVDNSSKTDTTALISNWPSVNNSRSFGSIMSVTTADNGSNFNSIYRVNAWTNNDYYNGDHVSSNYVTTISEQSNAFKENGSYLLIDRCNKLIISSTGIADRQNSSLGFQSTNPGDNCYGITCLNENDRTFDLNTDDSAIGNGRYVQYTKNYYAQPYSVRRIKGSQASLQISNNCAHDESTEFVIGRKPFKGIQVICKDDNGEFLTPGKYELQFYFAFKNWKLSDDTATEFKSLSGLLQNRTDNTTDDYAYSYIFEDAKQIVTWEACIDENVDDDTIYEKSYTSSSHGHYEMKVYDDHTEDVNSEDYEWEWEGDKFINSDDYRFRSTIVVDVKDPSKPIDCRIHIRYYNALGGRLYIDPQIKIKAL